MLHASCAYDRVRAEKSNENQIIKLTSMVSCSNDGLPSGFRLCSVVSVASPLELELQLSGTLNDFPHTAGLAWHSRFLADKWRAACSDKRSVTDLCGPIPRSG